MTTFHRREAQRALHAFRSERHKALDAAFPSESRRPIKSVEREWPAVRWLYVLGALLGAFVPPLLMRCS